MINRRQLVATTTAAAVTAAVTAARGAAAAAISKNPAKVDPRGHDGIFERLPRLDLESHYDFVKSQRSWTFGKLYRRAATRVTEIFAAKGVALDAEIPLEDVINMVADDPIVSLSGKAFLDAQYLKYKVLQDHMHKNADLYLSELEASEKMGPKLELNPNMAIPEYCLREIHTQPGGYCGDEFAGYLYHYGTTTLNDGFGEQDETHMRSASRVPAPADGRVRRVLDLGTGVGQLATSMKRRFPEAEVWGIDVGAPMVRYAHMRASHMNVDVHFAQRLAEDTKFPDNHFDIVTSYLLHHEMSVEGNIKMINEVKRILRPGGVFYPIDLYSSSKPSKMAWDRYRVWWNYRWNNEHFYIVYGDMDFNGQMRKAGLLVDETSGPAGGMGGGFGQTGQVTQGARNVIAIKA